VVLIDDLTVRAAMTGSWLRQMGFKDVFVLTATGDEREPPRAPLLADEPAADLGIGTAQLTAMLARGEAVVVDLSPSRDYLKGHIPGAWFAIRARLATALTTIAPARTLVLTSEDGVLAAIAASEAADVAAVPVRYLAGGNAAWLAAGHSLATEPRMADEPVDTWLKPYERSKNVREAMDEYLKWEVDLLPRIARDGSADFAQFRPG
jgi:rhodanese-related sulfurtransferase